MKKFPGKKKKITEMKFRKIDYLLCKDYKH